jgi:chemotaxis protein MotB
MKRTSIALLGLAVGLSACASGNKKISEQQAQIASLESRANLLTGQGLEKDQKLAAVEAEKAELDGKVKELEGKVAAAQAQIDSLQQSNKALSKSLEANQGDMGAQLKQAIEEKDKLAKRLNEVSRERGAVERQRASAAAKLAALKTEAAGLSQKLDAAKAAAAQAETERSAHLAQVHDDMGKLADSVLKEIESEQAAVEQKGDTIELTLREPLLFEAQQAKITEPGTALLERVGNALRALPKRAVRVEGHSDNSPIKWELFGRFTSHWDLSAARATAVARYLHEHSGLDPRELTASGFGEFRPAKGNDKPEGRAANRRIVLVVEPEAK